MIANCFEEQNDGFLLIKENNVDILNYDNHIIKNIKNIKIYGFQTLFNPLLTEYSNKKGVIFYAKDIIYADENIVFYILTNNNVAIHILEQSVFIVCPNYASIFRFCFYEYEMKLWQLVGSYKCVLNNTFMKKPLISSQYLDEVGNHKFIDYSLFPPVFGVEYRLIIDSNYTTNSLNDYFNIDKGKIPKLGEFERIYKKDGESYNDDVTKNTNYSEEQYFKDSLIISSLDDQNSIQDLLVPNIFTLLEYNALIEYINNNTLKQISLVRSHKEGYSIQIDIKNRDGNIYIDKLVLNFFDTHRNFIEKY